MDPEFAFLSRATDFAKAAPPGAAFVFYAVRLYIAFKKDFLFSILLIWSSPYMLGCFYVGAYFAR